jgi:hypothetical protein
MGLTANPSQEPVTPLQNTESAS